jgi:hypothetical protein
LQAGGISAAQDGLAYLSGLARSLAEAAPIRSQGAGLPLLGRCGRVFAFLPSASSGGAPLLLLRAAAAPQFVGRVEENRKADCPPKKNPAARWGRGRRTGADEDKDPTRNSANARRPDAARAALGQAFFAAVLDNPGALPKRLVSPGQCRQAAS